MFYTLAGKGLRSYDCCMMVGCGLVDSLDLVAVFVAVLQ